MTAEGRRRETMGERFARAASVIFDKRGRIVLVPGVSSGLSLTLFSDHAPLALNSDFESTQRELPLG